MRDGLHQGTALNPLLFITVMEITMKEEREAEMELLLADTSGGCEQAVRDRMRAAWMKWREIGGVVVSGKAAGKSV